MSSKNIIKYNKIQIVKIYVLSIVSSFVTLTNISCGKNHKIYNKNMNTCLHGGLSEEVLLKAVIENSNKNKPETPVETLNFLKSKDKSLPKEILCSNLNKQQKENYREGKFYNDIFEIFANFNVEKHFDDNSKIALFLKTFLFFEKGPNSSGNLKNKPWKLIECKNFLKKAYGSSFKNDKNYVASQKIFKAFFERSKQININDFISSSTEMNNKFFFSLLKNLINEKGNSTIYFNKEITLIRNSESSDEKEYINPEVEGLLEVFMPKYVEKHKDDFKDYSDKKGGFMSIYTLEGQEYKKSETSFLIKEKQQKKKYARKQQKKKYARKQQKEKYARKQQKEKYAGKSQEERKENKKANDINYEIMISAPEFKKNLQKFENILKKYNLECADIQKYPKLENLYEISLQLEKLKKKIEILKNIIYKDTINLSICKKPSLLLTKDTENLFFLLFDELSKHENLSFQERVELFSKLGLLGILVKNTESILNNNSEIVTSCNCKKKDDYHYMPAFMKETQLPEYPIYFIMQFLYIDYKYISDSIRNNESEQIHKNNNSQLGNMSKRKKENTNIPKKKKVKGKKLKPKRNTPKKKTQNQYHSNVEDIDEKEDTPIHIEKKIRTFKKIYKRKGFFDDENYYVYEKETRSFKLNHEEFFNYCKNKLGKGGAHIDFFKINNSQEVEYQNIKTPIKIKKLANDGKLDIYLDNKDLINASWFFVQSFYNAKTLYTIDNTEFEKNAKIANLIKSKYKYNNKTLIIPSASPTLPFIKYDLFDFKNIRQGYTGKKKHIALIEIGSEIDVVCHNENLLHIIEEKNINISNIISDHNKNTTHAKTELEKIYFQFLRDLKILYSKMKVDDFNEKDKDKIYRFTLILSSKYIDTDSIMKLNNIINQCNQFLIKNMNIKNFKKLKIDVLTASNSSLSKKNFYTNKIKENNILKKILRIAN